MRSPTLPLPLHRVHRVVRAALPSAAIALGALFFGGCAFGADDPGDVALRFWEAARDRDRETVLALSTNSDDINLDFEDEGSSIESVEIWDVEIDGDEAEVETRIEAVNEDRTLDIEFETVLVKRDGEWLVDLGETAGNMVGAMLGASMEQLGEAIGEGIGEAMEGMAEGLAEGMEEMGKSMQKAAEEMREKKGNDN